MAVKTDSVYSDGVNEKLAGWAIVVLALGACGGAERAVPEGGSSIHVLFDERHGLTGGELVRLHEFDIGTVESVDLERGRVRANVSLSTQARENLTVATTFTVEEDGDGRYLETHVLDPDADTLGEGATVMGADGSIELMAMRATAAAGNFVDDLRQGLDDVDWKEEERELQQRWEKIVDEMDEAVEEGQEELEKRVDELVKELEEVGRSDEARELRERFQEFLDELREGA